MRWGCSRVEATATTGSGSSIAFTVAAIATPVQMLVGDKLARWVYNNEPTKFAAIELVPKTTSDVPETLFGHLNDDGTVSGGIPIPGLASILSDPPDGTNTAIQGLDSFPEDERPTHAPGQHRPPRVGRDGAARHAADAAVAVVRRGLAVQAATPREGSGSCGLAAIAGVISVIAMEAGWVVTEVGRQPWIVFGLLEGRGGRDRRTKASG